MNINSKSVIQFKVNFGWKKSHSDFMDVRGKKLCKSPFSSHHCNVRERGKKLRIHRHGAM